MSIDELTRKHRISRATYFNWRGKYGEGGWNLNAGVSGADSAKVKRDAIVLCVSQIENPPPSDACYLRKQR